MKYYSQKMNYAPYPSTTRTKSPEVHQLKPSKQYRKTKSANSFLINQSSIMTPFNHSRMDINACPLLDSNHSIMNELDLDLDLEL